MVGRRKQPKMRPSPKREPVRFQWIEVTKDRTYQIEGEKLEVSIHRYIGADPNTWFFSCTELNIQTYELESKHLEEAKSEALAKIEVRIKDMLEDVYKFVGSDKT